MLFLVKWFVFYWAIILSLVVDNIFWISASPEYKKFKRLPWIIPDGATRWLRHEGKFYYTKLGYVLIYRIKSVLTHWRDIIPAIITSFILAVIPW